MNTALDKILTKFEQACCGVGLLLVVILIFFNVTLRAFGSDIGWITEMVRYLIILVSFVGASLCVREGMHISIDIIVVRLKGRVRKSMNLMLNTIGLLFSLAIVIFSIQLIFQIIDFPQKSPALQIPMYIPYSTILIGFGLSCIRYIQLMKDDILSFKN